MPRPPESLSVRFGDDLMADGFTAVPNLVLQHYTHVDMTHQEMMWTIHVWEHWWSSRRDPYPALGSIAAKMGISRRQSIRYAESLKAKGLLHIEPRYVDGKGQATNEYDFGPMLKTIREHVPRCTIA
jgi:DNA replication protein